MILLSAEQDFNALSIAAIVRKSVDTVVRGLKRYLVEKFEGFKDTPPPGGSILSNENLLLEIVGRGAAATSECEPNVLVMDLAASH